VNTRTSTSAHRAVTAHLRQAPRGRGVGALFDLDRTLLEGFSAYPYLGERLARGAMTPREMVANLVAMLDYKLGRTGFSGVVGRTTEPLRGIAESVMEELGEDVFRKRLMGRIFPEAKALVQAHRERGHTLAIISSATRYQIEPVARYLGIEHVLCTQLEVKDGALTGKVIRPTCYGEGKATAARRLAAREGLDLAASYFYTDSAEDLPLLEIVGKPHALNPDAELERIARERGWPVQRFRSRASGAREALGTALAYGSMIPAVLFGQTVGRVTGSPRGGINLAMSSWADFAAMAIGLDLRVTGRQHLWSHRPAVFIFNHQSQADAVIVAKLLRGDFTGIAKIEVSAHPIVGPMFKAMQVVFVDRSDGAKAREALAPAVEALRNGTSLVLAPEGTRSETERLGPFKKGAFHMAMQAQVPIVPIVIHNAIESQPKGERVFRPATVRVEVLPPVSTAGWRPETIDRHAAEVRALYLEALGQQEPSAAVPKARRRLPARKPAATSAPTKPRAKSRPSPQRSGKR
jgi:putative phosphoserine phosphatase/1-acylglycerol-3-phosphate O-acyltransferase